MRLEASRAGSSRTYRAIEGGDIPSLLLDDRNASPILALRMRDGRSQAPVGVIDDGRPAVGGR
ncbi:MAG: hypothetical protein KY461_10745, partial [Actinobacteria bacterium]|nr:hypothetical protein [Actinomycetota bacterium]